MLDMTQDTTELTDDQILENSQRLRNKLVNSLIKDGKMPTDKDDKYILLGALKDMDKQVIDKKRVAIEDKNANVAAIVAEAVSKIADVVNGDPFKRQGVGEIPVTDHTKLPDYIPNPGEMEIGVTNETYEGFMSTHGKNKKSSN